MQPTPIDYSILGQLIQALGVLSLTLLFYMLHRTLPSRYFRYWLLAWASMAIALLSLQAAFRTRPLLDFLEFFYFFGEYLFALMLWAGFAVYSDRPLPNWFRWHTSLGLLALWSASLTWTDFPFGQRFTLHALVFSITLAVAWLQLWHLQISLKHYWAKQFALVSLGLLTLLFLGNGLDVTNADFVSPRIHDLYNAYQSIIDVMVEILLAFSLLTLATAYMESRLARANNIVSAERDRFAMIAHQDALTGCLNRHALHELERNFKPGPGSLVLIDINDLKIINDTCGHQTGDAAISLVAQVVRECFREHDHLFRYGGDEFVLLAFDCPEEEVNRRLHAVSEKLEASSINKVLGFPLRISWGIESLQKNSSFKSCLDNADRSMYEHKLVRQN